MIPRAALLFIPVLCAASAVHGEPLAPGADAPLCPEQLVCMSPCELEELYRSAEPGPIPNGYARGKAIRYAGTSKAVRASKMTGLVWHGKWFDCTDGTLLNEWCFGVKAIRAQVSYGPSWLDGRPSIIMDYGATSTVWRDVRDELRQIGPGLYLGLMYQRKCPCPKFKMFFALQTDCCGE